METRAKKQETQKQLITDEKQGKNIHSELIQYIQEKDLNKLNQFISRHCPDVNSIVFRMKADVSPSAEDFEFTSVSTNELERRYLNNEKDFKSYHYYSLLQILIEIGWAEGVKFLLINKKADAKAFHYASYANSKDSLYQIKKDSTPLLMALMNYKEENYKEWLSIIEALLNHYARVNVSSDLSNTTALHLACQKDLPLATIKLIYQHRVNINALDDLEKTPLQYVKNNFVATFLLSKGAKENIPLDKKTMRLRTGFVSANLDFVPHFQKHLNDHILQNKRSFHDLKDIPLSEDKKECLEYFIRYLNANLPQSPEEIVDGFAKAYFNEKNINPFEKLQEQREKRMLFRLFNPEYSDSIDVFRKYLGEEKCHFIDQYLSNILDLKYN